MGRRNFIGHRIHTSAGTFSSWFFKGPLLGTGIKLHFKGSKGNLLKMVERNEGYDIVTIAMNTISM
ncbi:hypothetical protein BDQ17DRAFT_1375724 [Cyathus striatus]|nr:hypothetical protein BDQ17DRAFT_1375724 [Cyathus striatus]